jgi:uncharacterized phage protein gp47/JayE
LPSLPTQSFNQIVTNTIAGIQGRASKFINFQQGSSLRAIVEGFGGVYLWFQALVLQLLAAIRLSTSSGADVDTFTADFMPVITGSQTTILPNGSPRLGAQFASGNVVYSRFTAAPTTCFIPVGSTLTTTDGTNTQFAVVANATFGTYSSLLNGYTLASSVASITVPVQAVVAGASGNVASGALSSITSPLQGIDTVTNQAAFVNGANQESDSALKQRFSAYILGLSRGDFYGLNASIEGAAVNVQYTLTEGYNYDGSYHPGYFVVVADDGSGTPSPAFLAIVTAAANAVRPLSIQFVVLPPVVILASVSMQVTTAQGYDHNTVCAQIAAAVALNINSLGLGNSLPWSVLSSWAYAIPGVNVVSNVLLNGAGTDAATLPATKLTQDGKFNIGYITIKAGIINVS